MFRTLAVRALPLVALAAAIFVVSCLTASVQAQDAAPSGTTQPRQNPHQQEPYAPLGAQQTVHLPIINVGPVFVDSVTVEGQLLVAGRPLPFAPFMIDGCEDGTQALRGVTNADGNYSINVPSNPTGADTSVSLTYPATRTVPYAGTIGMFRSICTTSDNARITLPTLELGKVEFDEPHKGATVDMPIRFLWPDRSHPAPNEVYQVVGTIQYDCQTCVPVEVLATSFQNPTATPVNSIELGCVQAAQALADIRSGEFRILVSNDTGVGASEPRFIAVGKTVLCDD